ncbi:unnamed protein product [Rotaria magnacalcarata]|uniref:Uncharacterized protein n=5 Tax=Rotaria magnacalcarata TaxID=392030 RepID=A0A814ECQ9_9BILA|nr:unnamed protein product [Rotaria magnacalcarata]
MASSTIQANKNQDSLETYSIFWLDTSVNNEENVVAQKKLRNIINQLRTFVNPEEFFNRVRCIQPGDLTILSVSGQMDRIVVPEMQTLSHVSSMYVYCFEKEANLQWSQPYNKFIEDKLDELIDIIRADQNNLGRNEDAPAMDILDRSSTELNGEFLHSKLLIDVLIRMKPNQQDTNELLEFLKNEYRDNEVELKLVNEFHMGYESSKAVWRENMNLCVSGDRIPVIFEIEADPAIVCSTNDDNRRPFAQIDELSYYREAEVLFMLGSIFLLNEISLEQSSRDVTISIIRMTLCSDHDSDLKQLHDYMKNEYRSEKTDLFSLGDVMYRMEKFNLSEKYYLRRLKELPSNNRSLGELYQRLGMVANAKGNYDTSLDWYQKSLEILVSTHPSDHVEIGSTHNSIANAHRNRGDHVRALESYNQAVLLFKQAHDENNPSMAMFYNNIGMIYDQEKKYFKALDFNEKSLAIQEKNLPVDHPDLGSSYNNIGGIH